MKKFFILIVLFLILILSGCFYNIPEGYQKKPHSTEDAMSFIRKELETEEVSLSNNFIDTEDQYGSKLRLWEASYDGIDFQVASKETLVSDLTGEFLTTRYALYTNYNYCRTQEIFLTYPKALLYITFEEKTEYFFYDGFDLNAIFTSRNDVKEVFDESKDVFNYIMNYYEDAQISIRYRCNDLLYSEKESIYFIFSWKKFSYDEPIKMITDNEFEIIEGKYCVYMNTYRAAEEFSEEEIKYYIKQYGNLFKIKKDEKSYQFDDLNLIEYAIEPSLSYETLYEILIRLDFNVTGIKSNYTFVGTDDNIYQVSRDFVKREEKRNIYYFLKNGEQVEERHVYKFNDYFHYGTIGEITGLIIEKRDI